MPFRDPTDKRSSARLFRDGDHSARAQANAGSEPRDPFWWSAVLATRAAFAARPGAKLISVPLHGRSLSVSVCGGLFGPTIFVVGHDGPSSHSPSYLDLPFSPRVFPHSRDPPPC